MIGGWFKEWTVRDAVLVLSFGGWMVLACLGFALNRPPPPMPILPMKAERKVDPLVMELLDREAEARAETAASRRLHDIEAGEPRRIGAMAGGGLGGGLVGGSGGTISSVTCTAPNVCTPDGGPGVDISTNTFGAGTTGVLKACANGACIDAGLIDTSTDVSIFTGEVDIGTGSTFRIVPSANPTILFSAGASPYMQYVAAGPTLTLGAVNLQAPNLVATSMVTVGTLLKTGGSTFLTSTTAPTLTGFGGTGPSIVANGTAAFDINVGTVAPGNTGTITLPTASNGWVCHCYNFTTTSALNDVVVTGGSSTTCIIAQVIIATGGAANWAASDHLRCTAMAF